MNHKATLSLCMIVKNEEDCLARCLESVQGIVDEIIVVDTGSTDRTMEIAEEYEATIFQIEWNDDFSEARNFSLEQATSEWILQLDADEELPAETKDKVRNLLVEKQEGYYFQLINYTGDESGSLALKHLSLRLFRNREDYRYTGALHEQIVPSIMKNTTEDKLAYSGLRIKHYGYDRSKEKNRLKTERNRRILSSSLDEASSAYQFYQAGVISYEADDLKQALDYFKQALIRTSFKAAFRPTLIRNLALTYIKREEWEQAAGIIDSGLNDYPEFTDLYFLKAWNFFSQEKLLLAKEAWLDCLKLGEAPPRYTSSMGVGSSLAVKRLKQVYGLLEAEEFSLCLGKDLFQVQEYELAAEYLLQAIEKQVCDGEGYYMLGLICKQRELYDDAEQLLTIVMEREASLEAYLELVDIYLQQTMNYLERGVEQNPRAKGLKEKQVRVNNYLTEIDDLLANFEVGEDDGDGGTDT